MGHEARAKSRHRAEILANEQRCIYCANPPTSVEHMPPRGMFEARQRPSGLEFASCEPCNTGTRYADMAAQFFARMDPDEDNVSGWRTVEGLKLLRGLVRPYPDFVRELFGSNSQEIYADNGRGIKVPKVLASTGPVGGALMDTFSAKFGMAMYREHVGAPIPMEGAVQFVWYLNAGMTVAQADAYLRILPVHNTLRQGSRKSASGSFDYRFNTNDRDIVAALVHFHENLQIFIMSVADPALYKLPLKLPHSRMVRPGKLLETMPKPIVRLVEE